MAADCPRLFKGQRDINIDRLVFLKREKREKSEGNLNNVTQSGLGGGGKQLT